MENNVLGNAIKLAIKSRRLNIEKVALLSGVTSQTIRNIIHCRNMPRVTTLIEINRVLKYDLSIPLREAGYSEAEIAKINIYCKSKIQK